MKKKKKAITQDRFLKMFISPQTCDFCGTENSEILSITLNPFFYKSEEEPPSMKMGGYLHAKKCVQCCETD